ncbi:MAG: aldehyde dehydrogenase [Prevotellaceae bacterium]|nr:aldehyde dehydrogenase [Prevotellaceae bacterium]
MQNTPESVIDRNLKQQRLFFASHRTRDVSFRLQQLKRLKEAVLSHRDKIADALRNDLHKSPEEAFLTETGIVLTEIRHHIKHLERWAKPQRVRTPIHVLPSGSRIIHEPLGVVLIIAPWNYPFQLLFNPLVGAISAGCCAMLKTSPYAPATAAVMTEIIEQCFPPEYISITHGNRTVNEALLSRKFDLLFFTGSPDTGKAVMRAAAEHLTPVILELGGKSPCIVDERANLELAARRVAWGKTVNAGQTCIAPDYLLAHVSVKERFIENYKRAIIAMYGEDCKLSPHYPRIVSVAAVERLQKLMQRGTILFGGETDAEQRYVAPTIIDDVLPDDPIMREEIFGPLLPVMTYERIDEAVEFVNQRPKPLALYYFGENKRASEILSRTTSGGACINDTIMHIANHHLPFGGVGNSGTGRYHGRDSFAAFSNPRSVVVSSRLIDLPFRYPPFKYFKVVRKLL